MKAADLFPGVLSSVILPPPPPGGPPGIFFPHSQANYLLKSSFYSKQRGHSYTGLWEFGHSLELAISPWT